jgi:hypothetical protein
MEKTRKQAVFKYYINNLIGCKGSSFHYIPVYTPLCTEENNKILAIRPQNLCYTFTFFFIQRVTEIITLILTGNRTHQKEQLFSLPFWRKTLRNGLKNRKDFPKTVHISTTKLPKNLKQPDSYEVDFLLYG